ncbi:unnamed protein product [Merluccius merluccius]
MEWLRVLGLLGLCVVSRADHPPGARNSSSPTSPPTYLLLAPSQVSVGGPLTLSITILTSDPEVNVTCMLQCGNSKTTTSKAASGVLLNVPLVDPSCVTLDLLVVGYAGGGLLFANRTLLRISARDISTFIQTDKPNYRPGETVRIRVVSVGADRRPHKSAVDIVIKDPKGNTIRQWLSQNSTLGVVTQELQLSDFPPLGRWTIQTTVNDVESVNVFNVALYVLPKFEVLISVQRFVYHMDMLSGSVTAKHTYGKPVRGEMAVTFLLGDRGEVITPVEMFDGSANFELDLSDYPESRFLDGSSTGSRDDHGTVRVLVNVTESLTGVMYSSSAVVYVERSRYKISFESIPYLLRPSLNFTAKLKISTYNGQPLTLEDQTKMVSVSVMQHMAQPWEDGDYKPDYEIMQFNDFERGPDYFGNATEPTEMQFPIPADGVIPLLIKIFDNAQSLDIEASIEDTFEMLTLYSNYRSPSQSYLQIRRPTTPAQVGLPLLLSIESNFEALQFFYTVKSRNKIVESGSGSSPLVLTPEASWAPQVCLVVYYIRANGEVINDVLLLPVPLELQNKVSVSWSEAQRRPAEEVSLKLSVSEPQSLIGILVVDAATHQRDSHNDITMETVLEELYGGMREQQRPNPRRIGDPGTIFKSCDLIVLTDAALNGPYYQFMFEKVEDEVEDVVEVEVQEPRERQHFPETWLWLSVSTGQSNTWETTVVVPDSITTWTAMAFVMSENLGLGVLDTPAKLTVFQEFFISLNLPAFIIRGEELVLEVNVYNYLSQDLMVMVTVAQSDAFEFIFPDSDVLSMASSRKVFVPSDSSTPILFPIRPLALGVMPISVKAISSTASDAVRRDVVVKAEGLEQYYSTTLFVEMPSTGPKVLEFVFPADVVVGSERAVLTVVGDLLGPSIAGLESLILMPYGCGEQNMIRFAPNIYIIDYLSASGQSDPETVAKATLYMQKGYERELSYQRQDGSFSAFGDRDSSGSTWLSAFVLRCFLQARPYIPIDPNVLGRTAAWLVLQQDVDGRFLEPGRVIHTELQGGLDGPASLTAYVLMALLQDAGIQSAYTTQVTEALLYLETRLDAGISSNYSLCLVTYALALSGRPSATSAWDALLGRAQIHDGVPSWTSSSPGLAQSWQPRTADIEMAAYAVLTLHQLGRIADAIPIIKWLSQQRNHLGGYGSTQDTVVALQALSRFASMGGASIDLTITVTAGAFVPVATFILDHTNYMVQQSQQIYTAGEIELQVTAAGEGFALLQLNVFYNIDNAGLARRKRELGDEEAFHLNIELFDGGSQSAHLSICVRLVDQQDLDQTGMALLEVGLLSGFTLAQQGVQTNSNIKNVEEEPGKIFVYLDSVSRAELCVEIPLFVEFKVSKVQRASVEIIDYYEPRKTFVPLVQNLAAACDRGDVTN